MVALAPAGALPYRVARRPAFFLAIYALLAVALFSPAWFSANPGWIGAEDDPELFIWYLRWLPAALSHGHNPLLSNYLQYPDGFNLMWNTSVLVPALLITPVTLFLGAITAYNVLVTAALALSAWCAYFAIRQHVQTPWAAGLGGLLYGFSPFMVTQATGHLHIILALFPPIVLLLLNELFVRQRMRGATLGVLLGVIASMQLLTGEEIMATTAMTAVLGAALLLALNWRQARSRFRYAASALMTAAATGLVLSAIPLTVQFLGRNRVSGLLQVRNVFVADLVGFVVPGQLLHFSTPQTVAIASQFTTKDWSENGTYVGVPLLAVLVVATVRLWSSKTVRFSALLAVMISVLAMGPTLHIGGHVTGIPLPWMLVDGRPLVKNLLPVRLMLYAFLMLAMLLALAIDRVLASGRWWRRAAGASVIGLSLVPLLPAWPYPTDAASVPAFFLGEDVRRIPEGSVVLVTPFDDASRAMLWQAESGIRFRMPEGRVFIPGPYLGNAESPLWSELAHIEAHLQTPQLTQDHKTELVHDLGRMGVRTVIVGPYPAGGGEARARTAELFARLLGGPPQAQDGVLVWFGVDPARVQANHQPGAARGRPSA